MESNAGWGPFLLYWASYCKDAIMTLSNNGENIKFSEGLLTALCYQTDVGCIPRGMKLDTAGAKPIYFHSNNWNKQIEGCYWCRDDYNDLNGICCSKECFFYLHDWCVERVHCFTNRRFCRLPGCDTNTINDNLYCGTIHKAKFDSEFPKGSDHKALLKTVIREGPTWYCSNENIPTPPVNSNNNTILHPSHNQCNNASDSKPNGKNIPVAPFKSDFPRELQELLTLHTDIGIVPRDCSDLRNLNSKFSRFPNWSADIKGCYTCGTVNLNDLNNKYFCRFRCYLIFYEWCRVKVESVTKIQFCQNPGCPKRASDGFNCCNREHTLNVTELYTANKIDDIVRLSKYSLPWYKKSNSPNELVPHLSSQSTNSQTPVPDHNLISQQSQQFQNSQLPQQCPMQFNNEHNLLFCAELTRYLYYETDVGPIPREIRFITPPVNQFSPNWSVYIDKCYWCRFRPPVVHSIACSNKCFFLLNEWLHKIYESSGNRQLCKSIGCTYYRSYGYNCCTWEHSITYDSSFKEFYPSLKDTDFALGPIWYTDFNRKRIEFYNREDPFYEFTNFYPCDNLFLNGLKWNTSEHYFQAMKFYGTPYFRYVSTMTSPRDAFQFSRTPEGRKWVHPYWHSVKIQVMLNVLRAKFSSDSNFRSILLRTGDAVLVEHTKNDKFWGDGGDGSGENRLGNLLMQVRRELQQVSNTCQLNQMPQNIPTQTIFIQQPCLSSDPMINCAQNVSDPQHDVLKQNVTPPSTSTLSIFPSAPPYPPTPSSPSLHSPRPVAPTCDTNGNLSQKNVYTNQFVEPSPNMAKFFQTDKDESSWQSPQKFNSDPLPVVSPSQVINPESFGTNSKPVQTKYSAKKDLPSDYDCPFGSSCNDSMYPNLDKILTPQIIENVSNKPGENVPIPNNSCTTTDVQCEPFDNYNPFVNVKDSNIDIQLKEASNSEINHTSAMEVHQPETNLVVTNQSDSSDSKFQSFHLPSLQQRSTSLDNNPFASDLKEDQKGETSNNSSASNSPYEHVHAEEPMDFELISCPHND